MADWLHCNMCYSQPGPDVRGFTFTNCGHIICHNCNSKVSMDKCGICDVPCRKMVLSNKMASKEKMFFIDPAETVKTYLMQVIQVMEFQKTQRCKLFINQTQKMSRMEAAQTQMTNKIQEMGRECAMLRRENAELRNAAQMARGSPAMYGLSLNTTGNRHTNFTPCAMPGAASPQHSRGAVSPFCRNKRTFSNTPEGGNCGSVKGTWARPSPNIMVSTPQTPTGSSRVSMRNPPAEGRMGTPSQMQSQSVMRFRRHPGMVSGPACPSNWPSSQGRAESSQCSMIAKNPLCFQTPFASPSTRQMHGMSSSHFTGTNVSSSQAKTQIQVTYPKI
ncbi:uncharacterized protein LOC116954239 isoform X2 [Petromyzon marinus]|uniref:uncharacterized protein LOC116954239 isoform X2 n=1 Tax=Petromyzon marinus TaxID=7757 RepID=UPI003F6EC606